jgi:hypothetical protein
VYTSVYTISCVHVVSLSYKVDEVTCQIRAQLQQSGRSKLLACEKLASGAPKIKSNYDTIKIINISKRITLKLCNFIDDFLICRTNSFTHT